jgi:hypothetical protein
MAQFNCGDQVVQILHAPIQGVVTGYALDPQTGDVAVKVRYADAAGQTHERHFKQSELAAAQ